MKIQATIATQMARNRAVAAETVRPEPDAFGVAEPVERNLRLRKTELFSLIEKNRAAQAHQNAKKKPRIIVACFRPAPARARAHYIVVGE